MAIAHLSLADGRAFTLVDTVPAQHMYGLRVTVLLVLQGGLAFSDRQPFYPADIRGALDTVPQPRVLVTSPVHLRALLASESALPSASLVLSAIVPLPKALTRKTEIRLPMPLLEICGSIETGQVATRRTAQETAWHLYLSVRTESRPSTPEDEGPTVWVYGRHIETPVSAGNAIELIDDTYFLLYGRKADLINVAGRRSSLMYLNRQLNVIAGVVGGVFYMPNGVPAARHTYGSAAATYLVVLVVAPGLNVADVLRTPHDRIDVALMPRPLLLVDTLPCNETGRSARGVLAALIAQHSHRNVYRRGMRFAIPADHPTLPGYFPGRPIVSGMVLLDHTFHTIGAALGRSLDAYKISSAKFLSPAAPREMFDFVFRTTPSNAVRLTIHASEREVANGILSAPAPESVAI